MHLLKSRQKMVFKLAGALVIAFVVISSINYLLVSAQDTEEQDASPGVLQVAQEAGNRVIAALESNKEENTISIEEVDIGSVLLYETKGTASYYAHKFHNRLTANGERFNMNELSAAHKKLPFGMILKVTNLDNNQTTLVRINDRGPYVGARIIDLSMQAAKEIDGKGLPKVKLEGFKPGFKINKNTTNENYYYGYNFDARPVCLPGNTINKVDSTSSFNKAVKLLKSHINKNENQKRVYLFVRADNQSRKETRKSKYYIAQISENISFNRDEEIAAK